jgi:ferritin-like metal-binding protein YciE
LLNTIKSLFSDEKMTELRLNHLDMTDDHVFPLQKIMKNHQNIENIQLEGNLITDLGAEVIAEIIANVSGTLKVVNLNFNLITAQGAWKLVRAIAVREGKSRTFNFSRIQEVEISFNRLESHNELFVKTWDFLDLASFDIRGLFDKKYIFNADPKILARTFEKLAENYENLEVKDLIFAVLKVKMEITKPANSRLPSERDQESERLIREFRNRFDESFNDDEAGICKNEKSSSKSETELKIVEIEEIFKSGNRNYSKILEKLIETGYDLNSFDIKLQETLLMFASRTGNLQLLQYLLRKAVQLDKRNVITTQTKGENAFLIACSFGNFECAEYLLSKGTNPYSSDLK